MQPLRWLVFVLALAAALRAAEPNTLTPAEHADGWKLLFDGRSLAGWRSLGSEAPPAGWQVAAGALTLPAKGGGGDLVSAEAFGDFELSVEWKVAAATNSGIIYRVGLDEKRTYLTGPEYQILDNVQGEDNHPPSHTAAALYDLVAPPQDYTRPVGEWNEARIRVRGWHVEHWLNGHLVVDVDLASPAGQALIAGSKFKTWPKFGSLLRGHIALQDHGHAVAFRSLKLRELK